MDDRKLQVLRAIVEDYVATQEPVGSKALTVNHELGVSAATVRNDMAWLEEAGYIHQPHTSAGRIPTDQGYRLFVDRLERIQPLSSAERRAVNRYLSDAGDLDDVVTRTVRLLSQLTHQVAVVQYPSLNRSTVRHIELLRLAPQRLLLVVITDTGRVEQRHIELAEEIDEDHTNELRTLINEKLISQPIVEAPEILSNMPAEARPELRDIAAALGRVLLDAFIDSSEERIAVAGAANLTRSNTPLMGVTPLLEALEEEVVLMRLLGAGSNSNLTVRIGDENDVESFRNTTVVATGYGPGSVVGHMGVVGPTRMDYPATMAAVRAVARYVSEILERNR